MHFDDLRRASRGSGTTDAPARTGAPRGAGDRPAPASRALAFAWALASTLLLLGACDVPTEAPILEHTWKVPGDDTRVGVAEFLPAGVVELLTQDGFDVSVDLLLFDETLGNLCPACVPLDGTVAPKPAFSEDFQSSVDLPVDVVGVDVTSGNVQVTLRNGLNFDPINPGAGNAGTVTVTLLDDFGGRVLDSRTLTGPGDAIPAGGTVTLDMSVAPGTVGTTLAAVVDVDSPDGDPVFIDTSQVVEAAVTVQELLVSSATVNVDGRSVDFDDEVLDLEDVDQSVIDAVRSGGFELDITNPFGAGVDGTLEITGPGFLPIRKPFDVSADPTSTTMVEFTGDELRSFMGQPNVLIGGDGTVTAAGPITVSPSQTLNIESTVEAVLRLNE